MRTEKKGRKRWATKGYTKGEEEEEEEEEVEEEEEEEDDMKRLVLTVLCPPSVGGFVIGPFEVEEEDPAADPPEEDVDSLAASGPNRKSISPCLTPATCSVVDSGFNSFRLSRPV